MRLGIFAAGLLLVGHIIAADETPAKADVAQPQLKRTGETDKSLITTRNGSEAARAPKNLSPGPDDSRIARVVGAVLERSHYIQQPFDDSVSAKFLEKYLDALDPMRMIFLQSDVREFEKWKTLLDDLTLKLGDTSPAQTIFMRFRERYTEQIRFMTNVLATETLTFTGNDRYEPNRRELARPVDAEEARAFWRDRLRFEYLQEKLNKEKPDAIKTKLTKRYTTQLRTISDFDSDDVLQVYLGALTHTYDPHSDYMGKPAAENFNISMKLSLFGIGALLQSEDGYCTIKELMDGPAKKSGKIKPKDKIVAVAQGTNAPVDVIDMKLNKVVELIRGPKGTEVRLTVVPVDAADPSVRKVVTLLRDEIKLEDQEAKAKIIDFPTPDAGTRRYGLIDLPSFYADLGNRSATRKSTTTDVAKLLKKLKEEKVEGIVLDLRRNGGGSLEEAINLTGLFIKEGPIVQVKDFNGDISVDKDTDSSIHYEGPLVVLTSRFSASASEILAGALQDYGRAVVVGDANTHGKGTVQTLLELKNLMRATNELGSLKFTIRKFYRASGSSTQLKGVVPDIILPSINNHADIGESALPSALPWDTVPAARYEHVNVTPPLLPELKKRSEARVAADSDFIYIRDEIARYKKLKDEKTVSLNEEQRRKEKQENEDRAEARKKELRARPEPNYKAYEITLKNALQPGLPPPIAKTNNIVSAGGSTNNLASAEPRTTTDPDDEDAEKDDPALPHIDPTLDEGWKILQDLTTLTKASSLAGRRSSL